jgi:hypothetical protein
VRLLHCKDIVNRRGGSVHGRRIHSRCLGSAEGTIRVCRDVAILSDANGSGLSAVSDVPVAAGEELTLSLTSSAGDLELRVTVNRSEPYVENGPLRHRLHLTVLGVSPAAGKERSREEW